MALSLNKSVYGRFSGHFMLKVLFAPLLFMHLANLEHLSIIEEAVEKAMFPKLYYYTDVVTYLKLTSKALG